ncbi:hypothetical protein BH23GEM6_BH23GEM6_04280 [soil metagenome]
MEADIRHPRCRAAFSAAVVLSIALLTLGTNGLPAQEPPPPVSPAPAVPDTLPSAPAVPDTVSPVASSPPAQSSRAAPDPWKMSAEMSFTDQSGNRVLRLLTGGLKIAHRDANLYELDGRVETRYGKSNGEIVARNHYASLAFDLRPQDVWSPFLFFNGERDHFKRLNLRFSGGAGAQYTIFEEPQSRNAASVSLALLYAFEDLIATEAQPFPPNRRQARLSLRVKGSQTLREGFSIQHTTFYQPAVDEMVDYLLRSDSGAKILLTKRLALSVGYQLSRTNRPPEGVVPEDRLLKTGFIIDF